MYTYICIYTYVRESEGLPRWCRKRLFWRQGLGFGVGFGVWGLVFGVWSLGFGLGFDVWGLGSEL